MNYSILSIAYNYYFKIEDTIKLVDWLFENTDYDPKNGYITERISSEIKDQKIIDHLLKYKFQLPYVGYDI